MTDLEFRMLGPLEVWRGDEALALPPGRPRALLGMLLVHANTVVTTDRLLDELWRSDPPRTAGHALQVYVANLRKLRLGEPAGDLLRHGAVVGRDFDVDLLCAATAAAEPDVVDALEEAAAAALLTSVSPGRYSFAHAVIQYTLYDGLSPTRRRLAHRRVAEALERLHGAGPGPRVAELARHWVAATASGERLTQAS